MFYFGNKSLYFVTFLINTNKQSKKYVNAIKNKGKSK